MDFDQKIAFFYRLICCGHTFYHTVFDPTLAVVESSCPFVGRLDVLLGFDEDSPQRLLPLAAAARPVLMPGAADLFWLMDFERSETGDLRAIHLIGPAFIEDVAPHRLDAAVSALGIAGADKRRLIQELSAVPLLPFNHLMDYGLMLHYALTDERLDSSGFQFLPSPDAGRDAGEQRAVPTHGTWAMEQELLRLIEEGDTDYRQHAARLVERGIMAPLGNGDTLRHVKNSVIIFASLCARAAIRGGLTPETAYSLSDRIINQVEAAVRFEEIGELNAAMQDEYVRLVHECRSAHYSPPVQNLRRYLDSHLERTPTLAELSEAVGFSASYLAREFKRQTGVTIHGYLRARRIELAALALRSGDEPVQNLAHRLGYSSQSYFTEQFKAELGMTPGEYRRRCGLR